MIDKNILLKLELNEVELISDLLKQVIAEYKTAMAISEQGGTSLTDVFELESEVEAHYMLECYQKMLSKVDLIQNENHRNYVDFIETTPIFRCEQLVETFRIHREGVERLVYVFQSRHGAYFFYPDLESLIGSFVNGEDSEIRFEYSAEMVHFLTYWKG